jgi:transposase InsO family protein
MKLPSVYLKMRVLGAVDTVEGRTRHERILNVANMTFLDEEGNPRQFTWRTIQTWYYRYKSHGITQMTNRPRKDKGQVRKTTPEEVLEALNAARPHFRDERMNKGALYRFCIEKGLLQRDRIASTTFYRFIREYELLDPRDKDHKKRLAFSMKHANQLWQADTMFGPFCGTTGCGTTGCGTTGCGTTGCGTTGTAQPARKQARLIAFIDDASRVLCHGEFFFEENVDTLMRALRAAFYKRGVPEQLLVDNGSIYCSQEITLVCARVGCILRHTAVRDAAAKGKIERFFRRVRDQFLVRQLDLSSLQTLNRQFTEWVENDYNATLHDAIGMKPIDRFGIDLARVRFLSPSEHNDELFYAEATRKVKKDNTFSFSGRRYETPVDLRDKEIQLRYDRSRIDEAVVFIYFKGQRLGAARLLDTVANGLLRRKDQP